MKWTRVAPGHYEFEDDEYYAFINKDPWRTWLLRVWRKANNEKIFSAPHMSSLKWSKQTAATVIRRDREKLVESQT